MEFIKNNQTPPDINNDPCKELFNSFNDLEVLPVFINYIKCNDLSGYTPEKKIILFLNLISNYLTNFRFYLYEIYSNKTNKKGWENELCPYNKYFYPISKFNFEKYWNAWINFDDKGQEFKENLKIIGFAALLKQIYFRFNNMVLGWFNVGITKFKPIEIKFSILKEFWFTENEIKSLVNYIKPDKTAKPKKEIYKPDW